MLYEKTKIVRSEPNVAQKLLQEIADDPKLDEVARRKKQSEVIIKYPESFLHCDGCESLLPNNIVICPVCSHFGFNTDKDLIIEHAKILGAREKTMLTLADYN